MLRNANTQGSGQYSMFLGYSTESPMQSFQVQKHWAAHIKCVLETHGNLLFKIKLSGANDGKVLNMTNHFQAITKAV